MSSTRVATFDCYGTLIDWEGGVGAFLYELARRHEEDPPPGRELRERWEALQFERIQGDWRSYRDVLADSLAAWAGERGYRLDEGRARRSRARWRAGSRSRTPCPALRAAREAGLRLWIISNTDRAIIEHSPAPPRGRLRRRDRGRGLSRLQAVDAAVRHGAARDRRAARSRSCTWRSGSSTTSARRRSSGLRTVWVNRKQEAAPGPGAARPRVERPLAAGGGRAELR